MRGPVICERKPHRRCRSFAGFLSTASAASASAWSVPSSILTAFIAILHLLACGAFVYQNLNSNMTLCVCRSLVAYCDIVCYSYISAELVVVLSTPPLIQANFGKKLKTSPNCTPAPMDPIFFVPLKGQSDASINARTRTFIFLF